MSWFFLVLRLSCFYVPSASRTGRRRKSWIQFQPLRRLWPRALPALHPEFL